MSRFLGAVFSAVFVLAQVGCGGGGGDASDATATPSPPPAPAPPAPPSNPLPIAPALAAGARTALSVLPQACGSGACDPFTMVAIDAGGEATFLWVEIEPGQSGVAKAANQAAGSSAMLSSGIVDSGFVTPTVRPLFSARPLGPRRFALMSANEPDITNQVPPVTTRLRVIEMQDSGAPLTGPKATLPVPTLNSALSLVRDSGGGLYAFTVDVGPVPAPIDLGLGETLSFVAPPVWSGAPLMSQTFAEFSESTDPRALWLVRASDRPEQDESRLFLADLRLASGEVLPPVQVSGALRAASVRASCPYQEVHPTSATTFVFAWLQVDPLGFGCDLFVDGQRINDGTRTVDRFVISSDADGIVVVWQESALSTFNNVPGMRNDGSMSVLWSRFDRQQGSWSPPAAIAPQYYPADDWHTLDRCVACPGGTMAISWQALARMSNGDIASVKLLSKYVNGSWTTVSVDSIPRALAINASGQGVAMFDNACTATPCEAIVAYRF